ncbi:MAG: site-2 protease family protein [candidate division WOR-3 bacterium]
MDSHPSEIFPFDFNEISQYLQIHKIGFNYLEGKINEPISSNIQHLTVFFQNNGYTAFFTQNKNSFSPHLIKLNPLIISQVKEQLQIKSLILSLSLFLLTLVSTLTIGSLNRGGNLFHNFKDIFLGIPFSFSLLVILSGHELGHYFVARKNKVSVSLPYFLPIPHPLIGTMGAFIKIKSIIPNRKVLIRIGIAGPLIGFIITIPITIIGIKLSKITEIPQTETVFRLGSSLLFFLFTKIIHSSLPSGYDIVLHPMAFAGWLGMFITAINLLPLSQLDGGHIAYAILGKKHKYLIISLLALLGFLGIIWPGWFFLILLILVFGLAHPPAQDEITPINKNDKILAIIGLIIFALAFIPNPFPIK